jgi:hypothetical protein
VGSLIVPVMVARAVWPATQLAATARHNTSFKACMRAPLVARCGTEPAI